MREIIRKMEKKTGRNWETTYETRDIALIYEILARDLISKKLNNCTYIKSIKRNTNYDGTQNILVTYDNNTRSLYTVRD